MPEDLQLAGHVLLRLQLLSQLLLVRLCQRLPLERLLLDLCLDLMLQVLYIGLSVLKRDSFDLLLDSLSLLGLRLGQLLHTLLYCEAILHCDLGLEHLLCAHVVDLLVEVGTVVRLVELLFEPFLF
jgi:hypothetical protein